MSEQQFNTHTCPYCGVDFGISLNFEAAKRRTGARFWCPANGCELQFTPPPPDPRSLAEMRRKLNELKSMNSSLRSEITKLKGEAVECRRKAEFAEAQLQTAIAQRPPVNHLVTLDATGRFKCPRCPATSATWQKLSMHLVEKHQDTSLSARYGYPHAVRVVAIDNRQRHLDSLLAAKHVGTDHEQDGSGERG